MIYSLSGVFKWNTHQTVVPLSRLTEKSKLLSLPGSITNKKGTNTKHQHSHSYPFVQHADLILWHGPFESQCKEQRLFGQKEWLIVFVCQQTLTKQIPISENNVWRQTENWFAHSDHWSSKGRLLSNDYLLWTHQLYVVVFFAPVMFQCCNSIMVQGEGHSLQGRVFGVHTDVCLHLNTHTQKERSLSLDMSHQCITIINMHSKVVLRCINVEPCL